MQKEDVRWDLYPHVAVNFHARTYLERLVLLGRRPKTIDAYARTIDDWLHSFEGADPEHAIEADEGDILIYLDGLKNRSPRKRLNKGPDNVSLMPSKRISDNTITKQVVALRLFYDFLIRQRIRNDGVNPLPRGSDGRHGEQPRTGPVRVIKELPWTPSDDDLMMH